MSSNLRLEEIVTIAKGVSEWKEDTNHFDTKTYSGQFTPNGSDKSMHVSATGIETKHYGMFGDYSSYQYLGSLKLDDTGAVELNEKQAKRVYEIAEKKILLKKAEAANAEFRKKQEAEQATIQQVKQVLSGDSTLCSLNPKRHWYRRFLG